MASMLGESINGRPIFLALQKFNGNEASAREIRRQHHLLNKIIFLIFPGTVSLF
jgi:hypothetical protein